MTNHGDDCYFYYYSTCAKGDSCPFRHCEAAMGSEVECSLWQENRCFRPGCMFRHMKIKKNRKEIPCYWEKQPSGCQKPHCAFYHEKSRLFAASNKGPAMKKDGEDEPMQEEPASSAPNPQLRGVKKADTQENVPSPTHPPVVINPVDDEDEDEDDQFSEEGEERSKMSSPRKLIIGPKDDSLNFGVRTLEEIRLRKALKANLKKAEAAGFVIPGQPNNGSTGEKENMRSIRRPALFTAKNRPEEASKMRITDRLEKRTLNDDTPVEAELPLKRSLAQRLGGKVDASEEDPDQLSQRSGRSMRERLGLSVESGSTPSPAAPSQPGPPGQIRIKTLEEIRQEKAAKSQERASASPPKITKTISETLLAKKKQEVQKRKVQVVTETVAASTQGGKEAPEAAPASKPSAPAQPSSGVRVKTLEEIRREKAARLGAQDHSSAKASEEERAPKRRILRINKPTPPASTEVKVHKPAELPEKPKDNESNETVANGKAAAAPVVEKVRPDSSTGAVKVKTFEEIMREKQLRKQEQEAIQSQATTTATAAQKQPVTGTTTPMPSQPAPVPTRQRITIKPKVAPAKPVAAPTIHTAEPPVTTSTGPKDLPMSLAKKRRIAAAPALATNPSPVQQAPDVDTAQPDPPVSVAEKPKTTVASAPTSNPSPVQQTPDSNIAQSDLPVSLAKMPKAAAAAPAPAVAPALAPNPLPVQQIPAVDTVQPDTAPKTSPLKKSPENKVKPKVNVKPVVKPSSVKPSAHVRPGQKRKAAAGQGSAVAAVKPLSAAAATEEVPELQEPPCKHSEVSITAPPSALEAGVTQNPLQGPTVSSSALESSAQQNDEPQTVPVFEQSPATTITSSSVENLMAVPQSPSVLKTPSQTRARKGSTTNPRITSSTASSTSAVDDFEELINEFEMDDEVDLEPDKGEDDLLLELSEMIGS